MVAIPNQSSGAKTFMEFDDDDRMKPSNSYDRIIDVLEEMVRFTILTRNNAGQPVDRYSERRPRACRSMPPTTCRPSPSGQHSIKGWSHSQ